ncbi:MAG TPA: FadR/GntR family transcriptional regulator [Ramlibacter sp.]|nr:FadR/GntR family transcriptional regulator [Ramlibacter sp.]
MVGGLGRARRRGRSLAHDLVEGIRGQIRAQVLKPGDKLPTESEIMQSYGVSRTVVREALSRLQAGALVETRHGIGTFVLDRPALGFGIDPGDIATAVDVMAVLELRISLETESAGLAAQRRTEAQLAEMRDALDAFEATVGGSNDAVPADFRFHLAIAQATGNRYFADIMSHLGATLIPRTRINSSRVAQEDLPNYLRRVNREHEEIYSAIARGDGESARAAMRIHLTNSRERLRRAQEAVQAAAGVQPG